MVRVTYSICRHTYPFTSYRNTIIEITKALTNYQTVIDLGCGRISPLRFLPSNVYTYGIDIYTKDLHAARKNNTHNAYINDDILNIDKHFSSKSVDACVCLDVIEHLTKADGQKLIKKLKKIARKKILIITPNGFLPQSHQQPDDFQPHLSGWASSDFTNLGFMVFGLNGHKKLRDHLHQLKHFPSFLWSVISWLTQVFYCKYHPAAAAALFCILEFD